MTVILTVTAVIISILTPGRSSKTPSNDVTVVQSNTYRNISTADVNNSSQHTIK